MSYRMYESSRNPWVPKRVDTDTFDGDAGVFYDGKTLLTIMEVDDDEVDYDAEYVGLSTYVFSASDKYGTEEDGGVWTGYKSVSDYISQELASCGVWMISDHAYCCGTRYELAYQLYDEEGIDLGIAMKRIDGKIVYGRTTR